jgi:hypothetical protein
MTYEEFYNKYDCRYTSKELAAPVYNDEMDVSDITLMNFIGAAAASASIWGSIILLFFY